MRRRGGFVLLTILWIALILGLFAAGLGQVARRDAQVTRGAQLALLEEAQLAQSLIHTVWALRTNAAAWPEFRADGLVMPTGESETGETAVRLTPAAGLIDLNAATQATRRALLSGLFSDADIRSHVLQTWNARPSPFVSVDVFADLLVDLDRPEATLAMARLRMVATVYSGLPAPDITVAPRAVLALLPETRTQVDALLERRRERSQALTPQRPPSPPPAVENAALVPRLPVFHVTIAVRTKSGHHRGTGAAFVLPLPETNPTEAFYRLDSWPVGQADPIFAHFEAKP